MQMPCEVRYDDLRDDEDDDGHEVFFSIPSRYEWHDEAEERIDDDRESCRWCCDEERRHEDSDKVCDSEPCGRHMEVTNDLEKHEDVDDGMQDIGMSERVCESAPRNSRIKGRDMAVERCDGDNEDDGREDGIAAVSHQQTEE